MFHRFDSMGSACGITLSLLHYFYSLGCGILVYPGDVMGKIGKGQVCSVKNCNEEAVRSVNPEKAKAAGLDVEDKRVYVCKEHYKVFKKGTKKGDQIEKWRHGLA